MTLPEPETCAVSSALTTNGPVESTVVVMEPLPENVPTPEPLVWKSPTKIGFPDTSIWNPRFHEVTMLPLMENA